MSSHDSEPRLEQSGQFAVCAESVGSTERSQIAARSRDFYSPKHDLLYLDCGHSIEDDANDGDLADTLELRIDSPDSECSGRLTPSSGELCAEFNHGNSRAEDTTGTRSRLVLLQKHGLQPSWSDSNKSRGSEHGTSAISKCPDKRAPPLGSGQKPRSFTDFYDIKTTLSVGLSSEPTDDSNQLEHEGYEYKITQSVADTSRGLPANERQGAAVGDSLQVHQQHGVGSTGADEEVVRTERKQQPYVRNPSYVKAQIEGNVLPKHAYSHTSDSHLKEFPPADVRLVTAPSGSTRGPPSSVEYEREGPVRKTKTKEPPSSLDYETEGPVRKPRASSSASTGSSGSLTPPCDGQKRRKISSAGIGIRHFRPSIGSPKVELTDIEKDVDCDKIVIRDEELESVTSETTICSLEIQSITQKPWTLGNETDTDKEALTPVVFVPLNKQSNGLGSRTSSVSSQNSSIKLSKVTRVSKLASFNSVSAASVTSSRRSSENSEKDCYVSRVTMSEKKVEHQDGMLSPSAVRKPPLPMFYGSPSLPARSEEMNKPQMPKGKEALEVLKTDWQSYRSPSVRSMQSPSPSLPRTSPPKSPRSSPTQLGMLTVILHEKLNRVTKPHALKPVDTNANIQRSDSARSNRSLDRAKVSGKKTPVRSLSMKEAPSSPEITVTPPSSPSAPQRRDRRHAVISLSNNQAMKPIQTENDTRDQIIEDVYETSSVKSGYLDDAAFPKSRLSNIEEDEGLEADYTPSSRRFNDHQRVDMKGISVEEQSTKRKERRNDTTLRFVTHPPESSGHTQEGEESGAMDSNGFGPLRGGDHHPHPGELSASSEMSSMSLPDSCAGMSITSDVADLTSTDSPGWRGKKPWRSDPSGNKKEFVDIPTVINSVQAQSTPSLSRVDSEDRATGARHRSCSGDIVEDRLSENGCDAEGFSRNVPATVVTPSTPMQPVKLRPPALVQNRDRKADTLPLPGHAGKTKISRSRSEAHMHQSKRQNYKQSTSSARLSGDHLSPSTENLWAPDSEPSIQSPTSPKYNAFSSSVDLTWPCDGSQAPSRKQTPSPAESNSSIYQDKRYHIVSELKAVEQEYVDAMSILFQQYVVPLKDGAILDPTIVNEMFYNIRIPEIFNHHAVFLSLLSREVKNWSQQTTIGDIVINTFSKPTVEDSYMRFIKYYTKSRDLIEHYEQNKGAFQKFLEQAQKGNKRKHGWKDLIIQPSHRIPRYGLLLRRLLKSTYEDHPDYKNIEEAIKVIDKLANTINCEDGEKEGDHQHTLKKIEELLSISDLAVQERTYLRHDLVQVVGKKDQCCIWMFSDMMVVTTIKRRTGPINKRTSVLLKSPTGQDFIENCKHKIWRRISVEDVEVYNSPDTLTKKRAKDKDLFEEDLQTLKSVSETVDKLHCDHQNLDDMIRDLMNSVNNKLTEYELRSPPLDLTKLEIIVTLLDGVSSLTVQFSSADKRSSWEQCLGEAKQKLSTLTDRLPPVFMQYLPITKTRAGMQFSCASPIDGLNNNHYRDVWVCNSDGYVGHMCLLSLQPEPIVPQNTPVPGCNAKIMCICAVPAWSGGLKRKPSRRVPLSPRKKNDLMLNQAISMESTDFSDDEESSSSDEESSIQLQLPPENDRPSSPSPTESSPRDGPSLDPRKSTMWLGTDDGHIHIFPCSENIKVTKNKLRMTHSTAVLYMVYFDHKVYVSLSNGDLIIYDRTEDGCWDKNCYRTIPIGTVTTPITRMLSVAGKLWCSRGNEILILEPNTCNTEQSFQVNSENSLQPVLSMALSRQGLCAIALQGSQKVSLFHATRYEHLMDVSIAQAVAQKLQTADDIIRQHKTACLKITALLAVKDLLWVGTSAGVILTIPLPKITATTTKSSLQQPQVTGLPCGHTGHVRFLTCVEMPMQLARKYSPAEATSPRKSDATFSLPRRVSAQPTSMATKMMVISGGDGFEDFRVNAANEAVGKEDSTNHLLLWQV